LDTGSDCSTPLDTGEHTGTRFNLDWILDQIAALHWIQENIQVDYIQIGYRNRVQHSTAYRRIYR